MSSYMLDCETTGLDPKVDKIVTIQFQKLDFHTKEPVGNLVILKSWASSEKEILEQFHKVFGPAEEKWSFVSHTYNGFFEQKFLLERSKFYGLPPLDLFSKPSIDFHTIGIMMNGGQFKGSGLDKVSGKEENGLLCLTHYNAGEYDKVITYIKQEAEEFVRLIVWLTKNMPKLKTDFQVDCL